MHNLARNINNAFYDIRIIDRSIVQGLYYESKGYEFLLLKLRGFFADNLHVNDCDFLIRLYKL